MENKVEVQLQDKNSITHDDFLGVSRRVYYNQFIGDFYERMAQEETLVKFTPEEEKFDFKTKRWYTKPDTFIYVPDENLERIGRRVKSCSQTWTFDFYKKAKVRSLVRVDRCGDRFCLNCQALKADQRQAQYTPVMDALVEDYDLYHTVLTVPNVDAGRLSDTIDIMFNKFGDRLIRYFNGDKKIRNVNFAKYGYVGGVRALEITVSKHNGSYHPHLHCILVLKKGLNLPGIYWNRHSHDRYGRRPERLFTELEVLLQRVWCLSILGVDVTKENIEKIGEKTGYPDGFSCTMDLTNGDYHEVFKYAIKGSFKNETLMSYDAFATMYKALKNKKVYQCYGVLSKYDFNDVDESFGLNGKDEVFELYLARLLVEETPKRIDELLSSILVNSAKEKFRYVSKATFTRHFKSLSEDEKLIVLEKLSDEICKVGEAYEQLQL